MSDITAVPMKSGFGRTVGLDFTNNPRAGEIAGRAADCDRPDTELEELGNAAGTETPRRLKATAPWKADPRTFVVIAPEGIDDEPFADLVSDDPDFQQQYQDKNFPVQSVTVVGSAGAGFARRLAERGYSVRVYGPSTEMTGEFLHRRGGHPVIHGEPVRAQKDAIVRRHVAALEKGWQYADPGEAARLAAMGRAFQRADSGLAEHPDRLDLSGQDLSAFPDADLSWRAVLDRLGDRPEVRTVDDLYQDGGVWRRTPLPLEARLRFGPLGSDVFASNRLVVGEGPGLPSPMRVSATTVAGGGSRRLRALAGWLAETAFARQGEGKPQLEVRFAASTTSESANLSGLLRGMLGEEITVLGMSTTDATELTDQLLRAWDNDATTGERSLLTVAEPQPRTVQGFGTTTVLSTDGADDDAKEVALARFREGVRAELNDRGMTADARAYPLEAGDHLALTRTISRAGDEAVGAHARLLAIEAVDKASPPAATGWPETDLTDIAEGRRNAAAADDAGWTEVGDLGLLARAVAADPDRAAVFRSSTATMIATPSGVRWASADQHHALGDIPADLAGAATLQVKMVDRAGGVLPSTAAPWSTAGVAVARRQQRISGVRLRQDGRPIPQGTPLVRRADGEVQLTAGPSRSGFIARAELVGSAETHEDVVTRLLQPEAGKWVPLADLFPASEGFQTEPDIMVQVGGGSAERPRRTVGAALGGGVLQAIEDLRATAGPALRERLEDADRFALDLGAHLTRERRGGNPTPADVAALARTWPELARVLEVSKLMYVQLAGLLDDQANPGGPESDRFPIVSTNSMAELNAAVGADGMFLARHADIAWGKFQEIYLEENPEFFDHLLAERNQLLNTPRQIDKVKLYGGKRRPITTARRFFDELFHPDPAKPRIPQDSFGVHGHDHRAGPDGIELLVSRTAPVTLEALTGLYDFLGAERFGDTERSRTIRERARAFGRKFGNQMIDDYRSASALRGYLAMLHVQVKLATLDPAVARAELPLDLDTVALSDAFPALPPKARQFLGTHAREIRTELAAMAGDDNEVARRHIDRALDGDESFRSITKAGAADPAPVTPAPGARRRRDRLDKRAQRRADPSSAPTDQAVRAVEPTAARRARALLPDVVNAGSGPSDIPNPPSPDTDNEPSVPSLDAMRHRLGEILSDQEPPRSDDSAAELRSSGDGVVLGSGEVHTDRWLPFGGGPQDSSRPQAYTFDSQGRVERQPKSGERTEVGYSWTWRMDDSGQEVLHLVRRVFLNAPSISGDSLERFRDSVRTSVQELVNDVGYRLPRWQPDNVSGQPSTEGPRLELSVEFVDDVELAHTVVAVHNGAPSAERPMVQRQWFIDSDPKEIVHEILHGLGVRDDRPDPRVLLTPGGRPPVQVSAGEVSMMDLGQGDEDAVPVLTPEHLQQIGDVHAPYAHRGRHDPSSAGIPAPEPGVRYDVDPAVNTNLIHRSDRGRIIYSQQDEILWRFLSDEPEVIFSRGLRARDRQTIDSVADHIERGQDDQFVSATRDPSLWYEDRRYRYRIFPWLSNDRFGVDVPQTLQNIQRISPGSLEYRVDWVRVEHEQEVAFTGRVDANAVASVYDLRSNRTGFWNPQFQRIDWYPGELDESAIQRLPGMPDRPAGPRTPSPMAPWPSSGQPSGSSNSAWQGAGSFGHEPSASAFPAAHVPPVGLEVFYAGQSNRGQRVDVFSVDPVVADAAAVRQFLQQQGTVSGLLLVLESNAQMTSNWGFLAAEQGLLGLAPRRFDAATRRVAGRNGLYISSSGWVLQTPAHATALDSRQSLGNQELVALFDAQMGNAHSDRPTDVSGFGGNGRGSGGYGGGSGGYGGGSGGHGGYSGSSSGYGGSGASSSGYGGSGASSSGYGGYSSTSSGYSGTSGGYSGTSGGYSGTSGGYSGTSGGYGSGALGYAAEVDGASLSLFERRRRAGLPEFVQAGSGPPDSSNDGPTPLPSGDEEEGTEPERPRLASPTESDGTSFGDAIPPEAARAVQEVARGQAFDGPPEYAAAELTSNVLPDRTERQDDYRPFDSLPMVDDLSQIEDAPAVDQVAEAADPAPVTPVAGAPRQRHGLDKGAQRRAGKNGAVPVDPSSPPADQIVRPVEPIAARRARALLPAVVKAGAGPADVSEPSTGTGDEAPVAAFDAMRHQLGDILSDRETPATQQPGAQRNRPYEHRPITSSPNYAEQAQEYEKNLGTFLYQYPPALVAARKTADQLLTVLTKQLGSREAALRSFVKDDPTSAGQVGTGRNLDQIAHMLRHGNLREVMTAVYNAAYYANPDGDSAGPLTLKKLIHELFAAPDAADRMRGLGIDHTKLLAYRDFINGPKRRIAYTALLVASGKDDAERMLGDDIYALGNLTLHGGSPWANAMELASSQQQRPVRSPEEQAKIQLRPAHFMRQEMPLSDAEKAAGSIPQPVIRSHIAWKRNSSHANGAGEEMLAVLREDPDMADLEVLRTPDGRIELINKLEIGPDTFDPRAGDLPAFEEVSLNERTGEWEPQHFEGPEFPLTLRSGRAYYDLPRDTSWFLAKNVGAAMPLVAGISGTTARLLSSFLWLKVPDVDPKDFLLATAAWLLSSDDHSLYEILRGAEIAGITSIGRSVAGIDSSEMYRALDEIGVPIDILRNGGGVDVHLSEKRFFVDPLEVAARAESSGEPVEEILFSLNTQQPGKLSSAKWWIHPREVHVWTNAGFTVKDKEHKRSIVATDQLPHEAAYLRRATGQDAGRFLAVDRTPGFSDILHVGKLWSAMMAPTEKGDEPSDYIHWLTTNNVEPQHLLNYFGPAHILALRVYTGTNHKLINAALTTGSRLILRNVLHEYVKMKLRGSYQEMPSALFDDPEMHRLTESHRSAQESGDTTAEATATASIWSRVKELESSLYDEMRVHADMVTEALQLLPPAPEGTVFRGDWKFGGLSGWSSVLKIGSQTYGQRQISFSTLASASRSKAQAANFLEKIQNSSTQHKVLAELDLTGHAGRDISIFSTKPQEDEILLLPGAQFLIESSSSTDNLEHIRARETGPQGIAGAARRPRQLTQGPDRVDMSPWPPPPPPPSSELPAQPNLAALPGTTATRIGSVLAVEVAGWKLPPEVVQSAAETGGRTTVAVAAPPGLPPLVVAQMVSHMLRHQFPGSLPPLTLMLPGYAEADAVRHLLADSMPADNSPGPVDVRLADRAPGAATRSDVLLDDPVERLRAYLDPVVANLDPGAGDMRQIATVHRALFGHGSPPDVSTVDTFLEDLKHPDTTTVTARDFAERAVTNLLLGGDGTTLFALPADGASPIMLRNEYGRLARIAASGPEGGLSVTEIDPSAPDLGGLASESELTVINLTADGGTNQFAEIAELPGWWRDRQQVASIGALPGGWTVRATPSGLIIEDGSTEADIDLAGIAPMPDRLTVYPVVAEGTDPQLVAEVVDKVLTRLYSGDRPAVRLLTPGRDGRNPVAEELARRGPEGTDVLAPTIDDEFGLSDFEFDDRDPTPEEDDEFGLSDFEFDDRDPTPEEMDFAAQPVGAGDDPMQAVRLYSDDNEVLARNDFDVLPMVNASPEGLYGTNCVDALQAFVMSLDSGQVHVALPGSQQVGADLLGMQQQRLGLPDGFPVIWQMAGTKQVKETVGTGDDGALAAVVVKRAGSPTRHVFAAVKRNGKVWLVDPQHGRLARMPEHVESLLLLPMTPAIRPPASAPSLGAGELSSLTARHFDDQLLTGFAELVVDRIAYGSYLLGTLQQIANSEFVYSDLSTSWGVRQQIRRLRSAVEGLKSARRRLKQGRLSANDRRRMVAAVERFSQRTEFAGQHVRKTLESRATEALVARDPKLAQQHERATTVVDYAKKAVNYGAGLLIPTGAAPAVSGAVFAAADIGAHGVMSAFEIWQERLWSVENSSAVALAGHDDNPLMMAERIIEEQKQYIHLLMSVAGIGGAYVPAWPIISSQLTKIFDGYFDERLKRARTQRPVPGTEVTGSPVQLDRERMWKEVRQLLAEKAKDPETLQTLTAAVEGHPDWMKLGGAAADIAVTAGLAFMLEFFPPNPATPVSGDDLRRMIMAVVGHEAVRRRPIFATKGHDTSLSPDGAPPTDSGDSSDAPQIATPLLSPASLSTPPMSASRAEEQGSFASLDGLALTVSSESPGDRAAGPPDHIAQGRVVDYDPKRSDPVIGSWYVAADFHGARVWGRLLDGRFEPDRVESADFVSRSTWFRRVLSKTHYVTRGAGTGSEPVEGNWYQPWPNNFDYLFVRRDGVFEWARAMSPTGRMDSDEYNVHHELIQHPAWVKPFSWDAPDVLPVNFGSRSSEPDADALALHQFARQIAAEVVERPSGTGHAPLRVVIEGGRDKSRNIRSKVSRWKGETVTDRAVLRAEATRKLLVAAVAEQVEKLRVQRGLAGTPAPDLTGLFVVRSRGDQLAASQAPTPGDPHRFPASGRGQMHRRVLVWKETSPADTTATAIDEQAGTDAPSNPPPSPLPSLDQPAATLNRVRLNDFILPARVGSVAAGALSGLRDWNGTDRDCVTRVDTLLDAAGVRRKFANEGLPAAASDIAVRLGGTFQPGSVAALAGLAPGNATVVWTQSTRNPQHMVVVERLADGSFVMGETQRKSFTAFDPAGALPDGAASLGGTIRLPVDEDGHLRQYAITTGRTSSAASVAAGKGAALAAALVDPPFTARPGMVNTEKSADRARRLLAEFQRRGHGGDDSVAIAVKRWIDAETEAEQTSRGMEQPEFLARTSEILETQDPQDPQDPNREWLRGEVLRERYTHTWIDQHYDNGKTLQKYRLRGARRASDDIGALVDAARNTPRGAPDAGDDPTGTFALAAHFTGETPIHAATMLLDDQMRAVIEFDLPLFLDRRRELEKVEPGMERAPAAGLVADGSRSAERLKREMVAMGVPEDRISVEHTFDLSATGRKRSPDQTHRTIAEKFYQDEDQARATLRQKVLREGPRADELRKALWDRLGLTTGKPVVLLWIRRSGLTASAAYPQLDMFDPMLSQLVAHAETELDAQVVLVGDQPGEEFFAGHPELRDRSLVRFWEDLLPGEPLDRGEQLFVLDELNRSYDPVAIGMESGALEMPALLGMKTVYLESRAMRSGKAQRWMRVSGADFLDDPGGPAQQQPGAFRTWRRQQFEAPNEWLVHLERLKRIASRAQPMAESAAQVRQVLGVWLDMLETNDGFRTASDDGAPDWIEAAADLRGRILDLLPAADEDLLALTRDLVVSPENATAADIKLSPGELRRLTAQITALKKLTGQEAKRSQEMAMESLDEERNRVRKKAPPTPHSRRLPPSWGMAHLDGGDAGPDPVPPPYSAPTAPPAYAAVPAVGPVRDSGLPEEVRLMGKLMKRMSKASSSQDFVAAFLSSRYPQGIVRAKEDTEVGIDELVAASRNPASPDSRTPANGDALLAVLEEARLDMGGVMVSPADGTRPATVIMMDSSDKNLYKVEQGPDGPVTSTFTESDRSGWGGRTVLGINRCGGVI